MMNKYALIKGEEFPLVMVEFTGHKATDENFAQYLAELKGLYAKKEKLAIVFDASNAVFPGIKYQKMQGDWLKENEQMMKDYCVGTAYVITNAIIRGVLKTIFTFQKQPVPYHICSDVVEAEGWANRKLSDK
jgi:hypothetical protein